MAFLAVTNAMCYTFSHLGYRPINIGNLRSLLGCSPTNLDKCCYRGYLDTARRIPNKGASKSAFIKDTINEIKNFVNGLTAITTQVGFDNAFDNLCNEIISLGRRHGVVTLGSPHLTFGSAQKIVNMTLKYVYNEIRLGNSVVNPTVDAYIVNTACDFFHMPIDSIVLCVLKQVPSNFANKIKQSNGTWKYNPQSGNLQSWSHMNGQTYLKFVDDLRNSLVQGIKPLEAEYHTWGNSNPPSLKGRIYI